MTQAEHSRGSSVGRAYARWLDAHRIAVLAVALAVSAVSGWLASGLQLRTDLANLLPPGAESVRHLEVLRARHRSHGTLFAIVEADRPEVRERAARALYERLTGLTSPLIARVGYDDSAARQYTWQHRFLFADLADLRAARTAIAARIQARKLAANPLYVTVDDTDDADDSELVRETERLRARLAEAEASAQAPRAYVSTDGRLQLVIIRSAFPASDTRRGSALIATVRAQLDAVRAASGGALQTGLAGDVITVLAEQRSVIRGLWLAAAITIVLCAIALWLYFRAILPVLAALFSLAVGTLTCFGFAELAIGHLNLVTAFLAAIVVGNGINPGLILLARYFEEVRAGRPGEIGLGRAMASAARGTLAASLAAGVAYGSLMVTDFHGFQHFGVIGAVGMVCCWLAAFTVLPACLCALRRMGRVRTQRPPALGLVLARFLPRRLGLVAGIWLLIIAASGCITWRFITGDPLQRDLSDLRPRGQETRAANGWYERIEDTFDDGFRQSISGPFAVAVERRADTRAAVAALRTLVDSDDRSGGPSLLAYVHSLDDLLPIEQPAKLAVLDDIRALLTEPWIADLSPEDRALIERIRPPDGLRALGDADVPIELAWMFIERDGTRGRLILAGRGRQFTSWNVDHWRAIAAGVRALDLPDGAVLGGKAFVFSDMIAAMERDGPRATVLALVGALIIVFALVGIRRHGLVTLTCGAAGVVSMIALIALSGIEVNVIDFIALPITIGIGIDYAVNIAARARQAETSDPAQLLQTTGGAVLLCSFTTIVGYGSLLFSDSGGIRSFGHAALLGEIACVAAALSLCPALLARADKS